MINKTNMPSALNRRTVLQSAVAGSAILATTGLVHANGHPLIGSQLGSRDLGADLFEVIRVGIIDGAGRVPIIGGFLSFLGARIIPNPRETPEQMWRRLISASISDALMRIVQRDLIGLTNVANLYKTAIETGNNPTILSQSIAANTTFTSTVPGFQIRGEETSLLPLFAVAASLHLALLRDIVLKGTEIGLSEAHVAEYAKQTTELIKQYSAYVDKHAPVAIERARQNNPHSSVGTRRNLPLTAMLDTKTDYQLKVLDLRDTWKNLDPTHFPEKSTITLDREIYTSIIGWWGRSNAVPDTIPAWNPPKSSLVGLEVWEKAQWRTRFIFGFEMSYEDGTSISNGAKISTAHDVPVGTYIDRVTAESSSGIYQMRFHNSNGHWTTIGPGRHSSDTFDRSFDVSFPGHQLSSIHPVGRGVNSAQGAVSGCVLGFQLIPQFTNPFTDELILELRHKMAPQLHDWIAQ